MPSLFPIGTQLQWFLVLVSTLGLHYTGLGALDPLSGLWTDRSAGPPAPTPVPDLTSSPFPVLCPSRDPNWVNKLVALYSGSQNRWSQLRQNN
ncbi:hypothetical protein M404DRAFT_17804 [Pisolithus tinctorius Marx 270]|uniref:Uncharacterized protein n=1 Tax=Pisolithus tinctorius Marx 270 TaxID=870435 RepID=A0A0C3K0R3_PISTI|nr:hypothetical protein M404DRAFT_17804 [Pisolithus tinctorius Marx 270]